MNEEGNVYCPISKNKRKCGLKRTNIYCQDCKESRIYYKSDEVWRGIKCHGVEHYTA